MNRVCNLQQTQLIQIKKSVRARAEYFFCGPFLLDWWWKLMVMVGNGILYTAGRLV